MSLVVLTGATSGIGRAAAARLRAEGHEVVGVGRSAAADVRCDFASLEAVRELAAELPPRFDVLVNNAGIVSDGRKVSTEGIELTFAVNHLAPYLLTRLVLDRVSRVVTTASAAHMGAEIDPDDPAPLGGSFWKAYQRSKLANVLFTRELARRWDGGAANCLHPGVIRSRLAREAGLVRSLAWRVGGLFMASPAAGADTLVWLATSEEAGRETGGYFERRGRLEVAGQAAVDEAAERLWEISADMVGLPA